MITVIQEIEANWEFEKCIKPEHVDYLIQQAERAQELEENCSHLRKSFQRQRNKFVEGWEKVGKLEKENDQAMTRVHELATIAKNQKQEYKDLREEKRLAEEECERYKKMFSKEKGKSIILYIRNKRYEQALEFYGNEGNYKTVIENDKEIIFLGTSLAQTDGGEVARKVLESSRNEDNRNE